MNSFVRVYLLEATYALDSRYVYFTLPEQREKLKLGSFVLVPFGNGNRRLLAVVVEFAESSEYKNTKAVIDVVDAPVEIDAFTIELCLFLKSRTFCTFGRIGARRPCRRGLRLPARCGPRNAPPRAVRTLRRRIRRCAAYARCRGTGGEARAHRAQTERKEREGRLSRA